MRRQPPRIALSCWTDHPEVPDSCPLVVLDPAAGNRCGSPQCANALLANGKSSNSVESSPAISKPFQAADRRPTRTNHTETTTAAIAKRLMGAYDPDMPNSVSLDTPLMKRLALALEARSLPVDVVFEAILEAVPDARQERVAAD